MYASNSLMIDLLSQLNEQQREAVTSADGPLLILAGAGSGKTRVIAHRIAYLIAERGIWPRNILAVTFTNKAAEEMRNRVNKILAGLELGSVPLISTFHSLCVRLLRRDIEALNAGYTRSFTIYDQDATVRLTRNCLRDLGLDDKQLAPRSVQAAISAAKNRGEDAESYTARAQFIDERRASIGRVFQLYEERLHKNNALDFDDLLIKAVRLLRDVPEVRERYNDRFRYLLVDEYQDTNQLQFALIRLLTEWQQNICVVGDPDQSIYRWRGADIKNILKFEEHFPSAKVIRLEENYRSTQNILDVASGVIKHNIERKEKALWTQNPPGERIRYYQALDAESEARFVAGKIQEHVSVDPDLRAAVLYRTNSQSRLDESVESRTERQSPSAHQATAPQTIESTSIVSDLVKAAILDTGYEYALKSENSDEAEARLENLQELVNAAVDYDEMGLEGLRDFIDHSALAADTDQYQSDVPVTLMTAHSAKGLEFPLVFIVGLEDGLFPHSRSLSDASDIEEERRLCYVAMTRAEKYLYVTHAVTRRVYGEELASEPSQFLNEMPLELIDDLSLGKSWLSFARGSSTIDYGQGESRKERKPFAGKTYNNAESIAEFFKLRNEHLGIKTKGQAAAASSAASATTVSGDFVPGSYVRHAKYGRGLVLKREGAGESTKLTVSFPGYGQKKLVQKFAGLELA